MAQDYWRGGWANANDLPGTRAMKNSGSPYGPLNALADIVGAFMQKNAYEGGLEYASQFGDKVNALGSYKEAQPSPQAWADDFSFSKDQANQAKASLGFDPYEGMTDNGFVGKAPSGQPGGLKSYDDFATEAKSMIPAAAKELAAKYGIQAAQQFMPMLEQSLNDRIAAHGRTLLDDNRSRIEAIMNVAKGFKPLDASQVNQLQQEIGRYNNLAARTNNPLFDPSGYAILKDLMTPVIQDVNLGNVVNTTMRNKYGQPLGYDDQGNPYYTTTIDSQRVGMNPYQQTQVETQRRAQALNEAKFAHDVNRDNREFELRQAAYDLKKAEAEYRLTQSTKKPSGSKQSDPSSYLNSLTKAKEAVTAFMEKNPTLSDEQRNQLVDQINRLDAEFERVVAETRGGQTSQTNIDNNAVSEWVRQNQANGASNEEIAAELQRQGLNPADWLK